MAAVQKCSIRDCIYYSPYGCTAKRIQIEPGKMTRCETYVPSIVSIDPRFQCTHVASCAVKSCVFNQQDTCQAAQIQVGQVNGQPGCLSFVLRKD